MATRGSKNKTENSTTKTFRNQSKSTKDCFLQEKLNFALKVLNFQKTSDTSFIFFANNLLISYGKLIFVLLDRFLRKLKLKAKWKGKRAEILYNLDGCLLLRATEKLQNEQIRKILQCSASFFCIILVRNIS